VSELSTAVVEARHAETRELFSLRKTWVDPGPGIEMVQLHHVWTRPGQEPDWEAADTTVLTVDEAAPGVRAAVIEVPRQVGGSRDYLLHHFFFVVQGTTWTSSPVFSEEIVAREVTYEDAEGRWTQVGFGWGVLPPPAAPNYTAAAMDGLSFEDAGAGAPPEPAPIHEFVQAQPLPHLFRGLVWGPRGCDVRYVVHLLRTGSPDRAEDTETWDDNDGNGWTVTL
jgi:hypothetical protein